MNELSRSNREREVVILLFSLSFPVVRDSLISLSVLAGVFLSRGNTCVVVSVFVCKNIPLSSYH